MVSLFIGFHEAQRQIQSSVGINLVQVACPVHINHVKEAQNSAVI